MADNSKKKKKIISCGCVDIWIFSFGDEFTHYKPQLASIWSQVLFLLSHSEGTKMGYFKRLILSGYQQKRMLEVVKLLHD